MGRTDHDGSGRCKRWLSDRQKTGILGVEYGQATDFVLLMMNDRSAKGVLTSKVKLGADASAAAGPKGREVAAATDATLARGNPELFAGARSVCGHFPFWLHIAARQ